MIIGHFNKKEKTLLFYEKSGSIFLKNFLYAEMETNVWVKNETEKGTKEAKPVRRRLSPLFGKRRLKNLCG